jgi:probable HAF family extracellular repeat protein
MVTKSTFAPFLFLFCLMPALTVAQVYTVTDLGPLVPRAINTWGQVVGEVNNKAAIWTSFGGRKSLGLLEGGTFSNATAINDLGVVVGNANAPATLTGEDGSESCAELGQPFIWTSVTGMQGLGVSAPLQHLVIEGCRIYSYANDINIYGTVVGGNRDIETYKFGFLWTSSSGFSTLETDFQTAANGINNVGQEVVGQTSGLFLSEFSHAALWVNGAMTDLGTLGGDSSNFFFCSGANDINDQDQIVGWSSLASASSSCIEDYTESPVHAFLLNAEGTMQDLGALPGDASSVANKVNFFGVIIGSSGNTVVFKDQVGGEVLQVIGRPFIWSKAGGMQNLNALIPAHSGWVLETANGINIWGQIVGRGTLNGSPELHGFLLTPRFP